MREDLPMALNVRFEDGLAILSNFGRLMNDPRHFDAGRDVADLLDQGYKQFVIELPGIGAIGPAGLGLLTTLTRQVHQEGGELVLANVRRELSAHLETMRMDAYWEVFDSLASAKEYYLRRSGVRSDE
jgi:anti-sigma B factor antagonist